LRRPSGLAAPSRILTFSLIPRGIFGRLGFEKRVLGIGNQICLSEATRVLRWISA
jgi:hypothetical protein